jgi:LytS/YehU family sensor histidine kinase
MMAVVIMICHLLRSLYRQNIIAIENEELRTESIRSRYEALKNQMDPHFMFNSLNTLQSLIGTDEDEASDYVQKLSSVLRYTLQSKEVVTLADELNCVEAYCSMMQIRYGDNLVFDFRIDPKYHDYKVLPLSVQGLVENAIKHNVISAKQHLVIQLVTEDNNVLRVSNPIQPKLKEEPKNGTGLVNLSERYRLQWDKNVEIRNDGKTFVVILPLIEK